MHTNIIRKMPFMFLIIAIASSHSLTNSDWRNFLSDHSTALCVVATAATCIIAKLSHTLYQEYRWPNEKIITHCRTTYTAIYNDIQSYYYNYKSDSQLSDWDLKEHITRTQTPYPFKAYNDQIALILFKLIQHNLTITYTLKRINTRKKQLTHNHSEKSIVCIEELTQLEIKGEALKKHSAKIYTILTALKNKIALFKEYDNDYHNWSKGLDDAKNNLYHLKRSHSSP